MSKKTLYLLGILLTLVLGAFLYQNFCSSCCMEPPKLDETMTVVDSPSAGLDPFVIQGDDFDYRCNDNIKFVKNEFAAIVPFSDSVTIGFEKLKMNLESNPNKTIKITGFATSDEKNTSTYPNLAIARANDLKNYLVSKGFNSNVFELDGVIKDKWQMISDTLIGPASFNVGLVTDEWALFKNKINGDPLMLYFETNKSSKILKEDKEKRIEEIASYLKNVPGSMVVIVGHSDTVGARDLNMVLGQSRAEFAKKILVSKGIDSDRIETSSQGPDSPIADNGNEEGRSKNRRTVITIK
ncbi:MAG TPA: OmpA family protein [Flavobacterium sp.]